MPRPVAVTALQPHSLRIRFDDGAEGIVDLSHLAGRGIFASWDEPGVWESAAIGEAGQIEWNNGIELCPDDLYLRLSGKSAEDLFPNIGLTEAHA